MMGQQQTVAEQAGGTLRRTLVLMTVVTLMVAILARAPLRHSREARTALKRSKLPVQILRARLSAAVHCRGPAKQLVSEGGPGSNSPGSS